jgi:hypothetical protein
LVSSFLFLSPKIFEEEEVKERDVETTHLSLCFFLSLLLNH